MTPLKQTKMLINGEKGNCLATALASLLDLPVNEIPQFEEMDRSEWKGKLVAWLNSRGLTINSTVHPPKSYAIAIGWHASGMLHAIIVKDGRFFHDPHPSNDFLYKVRNYWEISKELNDN